jgi:hypothetical protein
MIDSKHQQLSSEEIVNIATQNTGSPYSPEQVQAAVATELRQEDTVCLREGNTLFVVHRSEKNPDIAVFRALNADTPENYLQSSVVFTETMNSMGFHAMVTTFYDDSLLNIFRYIGKDKPKGMGYQVSRLNNGALRVVVQLRPSTKGGLPA